MKKGIYIVLALSLCLSMAACQGKQEINNVSSATTASSSPTPSQSSASVPEATSSAAAETSEAKKLNAKNVADQLKTKGLPIENVIEYTEETDVNSLLGRPNQYTSKVNFADKRAKQTDSKNPVGGSIEAFDNQTDARTRYDYVNAIVQKGGSMFAQYLYLNGTVLLRIDGSLTPSQAKEYQKAFAEIMK